MRRNRNPGRVALVTANYAMRSSIQVHWFISQSVARQGFYFGICSLALSLGVTTAMFNWARNVGFGILVFPAIWVIGSVAQLIRGKRVLYVADQQDGLFLIGGLSDMFLTELKRMADEYTARTGS